MIKLTLMSREYCSLCKHMYDRLVQLQADLGFELEVFDVDERSEWVEKYDELVPVLLKGETEICHWHLDEIALHKVCTEAA